MQNIEPNKFIQDLKQKQDVLLQRMSRAQVELEQLQAQIDLAEKYSEAVSAFYDLKLPSLSPTLHEDFAGLSIKECLIRIARKNNGFLNLSAARKTLVAAGIFKDDRNASTTIGSTLSRNPELFKNLARGIYKLIEQAGAPYSITLDMTKSGNLQDSDFENNDINDSEAPDSDDDEALEDEDQESPGNGSEQELNDIFSEFVPERPPLKTVKVSKVDDDLDAIFSSEDEIPF